MKIFSIALISVVLFSFAFIVPGNQNAATPISHDETQTGSYIFPSLCANEDIEVSFRTDISMRGTMNGQKFVIKYTTKEQMDGVGKSTGTRYHGRSTFSGNQSGNLISGTYNYAENVSTKLVSQGSGGNFKSNSTLRYTLDAQGVTSVSRQQVNSECQ